MNIDNFDSGPAIEDIVRDEFAKILPARYSVRAGVINDRYGNTVGDSDVIIHNEIWFPVVKAGATTESRRAHLPIEGVYAVGEVKQTMDYRSLDEAMEKLVTCHRLYRPPTFAYRLVENRESNACIHGLTNPLYSFVIATDLKRGLDLDKVVERFFFINKTLERNEVVRALCVLGHGTITWGIRDEAKRETKPALFMLEDLYEPIIPVYHRMPKVESALYALIADLLLHLYQSVLAPEDIAPGYGPMAQESVSVPTSPEIALPPDPQRLATLGKFCTLEHCTINVRNPGHRNQKKRRKR